MSEQERPTEFFVYVDYTTDTNEPFYVGKGNAARVAYLPRDHSDFHTRVVAKHGMWRDVIYETLDEQEAFRKEIEFIEYFHTFYLDPEHVRLACNGTRGGEGSSGHIHSDEDRQKMSAAIKAALNTPEVRAKRSEFAMQQHAQERERRESDPKYDQQQFEKLSAAAKDAHTPEYRAKCSESAKKRWSDPDYREKISAAIKTAQNTPEAIQNHSEAATQLWTDPNYRKKVVAAHIGYKHSEETKAKIIAAIKATHNTPEVKQKIRDNTKAALNTPEVCKRSSESQKQRHARERAAREADPALMAAYKIKQAEAGRKRVESRRLNKLQQLGTS